MTVEKICADVGGSLTSGELCPGTREQAIQGCSAPRAPGLGRAAEPECSVKCGQLHARRRTDLLSLSLPPPPPRPVRQDPRPQTPTCFRSARAPQARAEGGAPSAAPGQRGPQSLCLEQGAAERHGLGGQG